MTEELIQHDVWICAHLKVYHQARSRAVTFVANVRNVFHTSALHRCRHRRDQLVAIHSPRAFGDDDL